MTEEERKLENLQIVVTSLWTAPNPTQPSVYQIQPSCKRMIHSLRCFVNSLYPFSVTFKFILYKEQIWKNRWMVKLLTQLKSKKKTENEQSFLCGTYSTYEKTLTYRWTGANVTNTKFCFFGHNRAQKFFHACNWPWKFFLHDYDQKIWVKKLQANATPLVMISSDYDQKSTLMAIVTLTPGLEE